MPTAGAPTESIPAPLTLFDPRAQEEVWDQDEPVGKVERADGGFLLSGRWGFSSDCDHCQ